MLAPEQVHAITQKLIDKLEKDIETIKSTITGIALLYKHLAEADGQQSNLPSREKKEEKAKGS